MFCCLTFKYYYLGQVGHFLFTCLAQIVTIDLALIITLKICRSSVDCTVLFDDQNKLAHPSINVFFHIFKTQITKQNVTLQPQICFF